MVVETLVSNSNGFSGQKVKYLNEKISLMQIEKESGVEEILSQIDRQIIMDGVFIRWNDIKE